MKKDLRRIMIAVTPQTLYHLEQMAKEKGYSKDRIGQVIDSLVKQEQFRRKKQ